MLHPSQTGHYAKHTIVAFKCNNIECKNDDQVYLNHCYNGKCNAIIDSRVSKQCDNGLWICESCGTCCSQGFFKYRLQNLEEGDNFDNSDKQWIYNDTKRKYDEKLGHLERAEYYCHVDGNKMKEIKTDIYKCFTCFNQYDTKIYNFKRPNRHLARKQNNDESECDFPF